MTQVAGYFPIRQQINTAFAQSWTFTQPGGSALNVSGYTFTLVVYDSPETMTVVVANSAFTPAVSGSGSNTLTETGAANLVSAPTMGYYELIGTPSGSGAQAIMHGPVIFEA